jgi:hypothetical protein
MPLGITTLVWNLYASYIEIMLTAELEANSGTNYVAEFQW